MTLQLQCIFSKSTNITCNTTDFWNFDIVAMQKLINANQFIYLLYFYMKANDRRSPKNTDSLYIQSARQILLLLHKQYGCFDQLSNFFHTKDSEKKEVDD